MKHLSCIDASEIFVDFNPLTPEIDPPPSLDAAGNPRVVNGAIDRGAYEYQGD